MEVSKTKQNHWTILSLIDWSVKYLGEKGFEDARLNVELLLCHVLQCKRIDLYLKFDKILNPDELAKFKTLFKRRLSHEPLQYILGETDFMGLRLKVDRRVFIPRPETEVLVESIIKLPEVENIKHILDVGTGSGNIAIAISKHLQNAIVDAVDINEDALEVAKWNIQQHNLLNKITLIKANYFEDGFKYTHQPYDLLVSNPPYISKTEFETLQPEIRDFEPEIANTDYSDGLTFYKAIAVQGNILLLSGGWIFVEIAYNQSEVVPNIFRSHEYIDIELISDYSGIKRVVKVRKP